MRLHSTTVLLSTMLLVAWLLACTPDGGGAGTQAPEASSPPMTETTDGAEPAPATDAGPGDY